ncbi:hypothetical protein D2M30_1014 [Bacillus amyloliquefaciens]|nr:hypothetical protein D2M30_1014 [Bacillus amyloliquefaciens]
MKYFSTSFLSPIPYYNETYKNENNFFENSIYYFYVFLKQSGTHNVPSYSGFSRITIFEFTI